MRLTGAIQSPREPATSRGGTAGDVELLRQSCLAELDRWMFEASDWEARTVTAIADLPAFRVPRARPDESAALGMLARRCHANVRRLVDGDPSGAARQVTGWWRLGGKYVLHSVLETENGMRCVTPAPLHDDDALDFIPAPRIEWREADGIRSPIATATRSARASGRIRRRKWRRWTGSAAACGPAWTRTTRSGPTRTECRSASGQRGLRRLNA